LRQVLGPELKYFVHRDAERLGDLLHMLIAKRFDPPQLFWSKSQEASRAAAS
jgi:hypothetical protein